MNNQNSHYDNSSFDDSNKTDATDRGASSNQSYEYVFSTGFHSQPHQRTNEERKKSMVFAVALMLSIVLAFGAGFGGALYARSFQNDFQSTEEERREENDEETVHNDNPESILDKAPSNQSIYGSAGEDVFSISQVVSKVQDSVVVIDVTMENSFGYESGTSSGSGVVISADGYVLTCYHVVESAKSVRVTLNSGKSYNATLVGCDADSDLAVLRISAEDGENFVYAEQGCSADLVVGERVVAIGNPLGRLGGTVTDGIISATERTIQMSDGVSMTLLQTNAAINSGNSGGGLFNLDGKLIGIVNAKYAAEGVEGLAFAIPIDTAYEVELDLIEYGYVRGVVDSGLEILDVTQSELQYYYYRFGIKTVGVYVVSSDFTDELQNKDRIVSVNGTAVSTSAHIKAILNRCKVGDVLTIVAERDGKTFTVSLQLKEYVPDDIKSNIG